MIKINRVLISVSDKTGIDIFAQGISRFGIDILSTSNTAKFLKSKGINVTEISDYTGFPELMDGLVKTLHPKIHGGILAERKNKEHSKELSRHGIKEIDMVVVNLYPFHEKQSKDNIDIGGVSLIRSAAKNYENVAVLTDIKDYESILSELEINDGALSLDTLKRLAVQAFGYVTNYDALIYNSLNQQIFGERFPGIFSIIFRKAQNLRYGENPHQSAAFYVEPEISQPCISNARQLHGRELSFNNILDANDALELVREFQMPTAAIIKHTNPSGVASRNKIDDALREAYKNDTYSAYGCVIALNMPCNRKTAEFIITWFVEVVICPSFDSDALDILKQKKNLRLIETGHLGRIKEYYDIRRTVGGLLVQTSTYPDITEKNLKVVSKRKPTDSEINDMVYAYKINKHLKSNAIVLAKNNAGVGMGAGQTSRVFSVKIAIMKAGENVKGAVMSSDAFFPFRDSIDEAAKAGITAIIQSGGSIRDEEVIKAVNERNLAMVFTGVRLFKH